VTIEALPAERPPATGAPPRAAQRPSALPPEAQARVDGLVPVIPSSSARRRVPRWVRRPVGPLLLLLLWQVASWTGTAGTDLLASPVTVVRTLGHLTADGELGSAIAVSLERVGKGVLVGSLVGVTLALLAGLFRLGEDLIDASVQMLRTVPFVGLIPLFIIWFGIGETPKIALVALGVAFPLYLNTYAGVRNVDAGLVEAARTLGLNRLGLIRHVILPGALPSVLVGVRYSLGIAWLALIFAEQINANKGIGQLMTDAQEFQRTDVILACLVVYAFLGLAVDAVVRLLERAFLSWRPAFSGA
jgi:sulfonate transport system permease protein